MSNKLNYNSALGQRQIQVRGYHALCGDLSSINTVSNKSCQLDKYAQGKKTEIVAQAQKFDKGKVPLIRSGKRCMSLKGL